MPEPTPNNYGLQSRESPFQRAQKPSAANRENYLPWDQTTDDCASNGNENPSEQRMNAGINAAKAIRLFGDPNVRIDAGTGVRNRSYGGSHSCWLRAS